MKLYYSEALRRGHGGRLANAKLCFLATAIVFGALVSPLDGEQLAADETLQLSYATVDDERRLGDNLPQSDFDMRITDLDDGSPSSIGYDS